MKKLFFYVLVVLFAIGLGKTASAALLFEFSYSFESGGILSGTFEGIITPPSSSVFDDTITVFSTPTVAKYRESSGVLFEWDTRLSTDTSSQASLIGPGESAFVSFDGLKMDFALSSNRTTPPARIFLENGIQGSPPLNNASVVNVPGVALIEEAFIPSNWNVSVVPIPAAVWLLGSGLIGLVGLRRKFKKS